MGPEAGRLQVGISPSLQDPRKVGCGCRMATVGPPEALGPGWVPAAHLLGWHADHLPNVPQM